MIDIPNKKTVPLDEGQISWTWGKKREPASEYTEGNFVYFWVCFVGPLQKVPAKTESKSVTYIFLAAFY